MTTNGPAVSLKRQILAVVREPALADPLVELGESIIDSALDDELLRNIPVLGSIVGLARAGLGIRDRLFIHKLSRLLRELDDIPSQQRSEFVERLSDDVKFRDRVLSHLILLLDRLDAIEKATLLGNAFRAYVLKEVSFEDFSRLAAAIDHAHIVDLRKLASTEADANIQESWTFPLAALGLLEPALGDSHGYFQEDVYRLSQLGRLFQRTCLM